MANMIARLGVLLGIDSAEFVRGIDGATKKLEQFGDAAETYGKIAATALVAASVAALKYADDVVDLAKANDVAVGSVLKLRNALQDNGGQADNAAKMLSSFVGFVDKTAEGSYEAQQTMSRLGVTLKDVGNLSIDELQNKLIKSLANVEDPITRNAMAMEVFGKAAKGVDFVGMAKSLSETSVFAEAQAKAFEDAAEVVGIFEKQSRELAVVLVTELGPPLLATIEYLNTLVGSSSAFGSAFKTVFQTVAVIVTDIAFVISGIAEEISHTIDNAKLLANLDIKGAIAANEAYAKRNEQRRLELDKLQFQIMGSPDGRRGLDDPRIPQADKPSGPLRGTKLAEGPEAKAARLEAEREAKRLAAEAARLEKQLAADAEREATRLRENELKIGELRNQTVGLNKKTNEQLKERQTLESLSLDRQRSILDYEQQTRLLREKDKQFLLDVFNIRAQNEDKIRAIQQETNLLEADREERIANQNALAEKAIELAKERNRVMRELQEGDERKGFGKRMEEFFAFAPTQMENGAQLFDSLLGNMTGALDKFVSTGKLSFKDLTRSIIQDMIRIQIRAQMIRLFSGMFGGGGFGTGNKFGNQDLGGFLADGGPANANTPYVVGERGPEVFVPRSSGTVIPNNQINNMMGSSTTVTNNYINAIDVKSFETKLLESSNTIWAGYQYANKQLASNGRRA
jgi:lambda family phage tail tape measure protein